MLYSAELRMQISRHRWKCLLFIIVVTTYYGTVSVIALECGANLVVPCDSCVHLVLLKAEFLG